MYCSSKTSRSRWRIRAMGLLIRAIFADREHDPRKRRGPENREILRRGFNPISVMAQNAASSPLAGEKCAGENRKL